MSVQVQRAPRVGEVCHTLEDLVYEKVTGALIGFTSLGDTNEHLLKNTCY